MFRVLVIVTLAFLALSHSGCSVLSHEAPTEDADKAAALFFQRLDKQEYDVIYDDTAKRFKENKTRQTVTESLKELTAHGRVLDFQRTSMPISGEGKERMVQPVYKTAFERMSGDVILTFQDEGGEWKLLGFAFKPHRS
ncbi:MAG TPA: hypothetical protein VLM38_16345 [Blastocatellia bacterium]|nr:hypothetical protein [Blastocatellia bacterium]